MATTGWVEFGGVEVVNLARTVQLAHSLGIDAVKIPLNTVEWIQTELVGSAYDDVTNAPWYDAGVPASAEFAGFIPLDFAGLGDSTLESTPVEYITDGGHPGKARHATLTIVADGVLVAATERGADFGKRWLERVLRSAAASDVAFCSGTDFEFFRNAPKPVPPVAVGWDVSGWDTDGWDLVAPEPEHPPKVHYRNVRLTRGVRVTRDRRGSCQVLRSVTFTLTAADPFLYGAEEPQITELSATSRVGPAVVTQGTLAMTQQSCPVYDYTPIYDPLYPALVQPPTVPDFYPAGWNINIGDTFTRYWARIEPFEPSEFLAVPIFKVQSTAAARRVRLSIWPATADTDTQCDPLFCAIVNYLPADQQFFVDGEQQAAYVWDGASPAVRRTDSLVYGPDATPVDWTSFNDHSGLLVTMDIFDLSGGGQEGGGNVKASLSLMSKSD